ncbi:hypothetical protein HN682_00805 [Candidatus Peregrinibacteria bacterium]|nr:hypothetical protein [Candidatus Peregrinibacteria bacterium]
MKCECCKINEAEVKDFRTTDEITSSYRVCRKCQVLSDEDFREKKYETNKIVSSGDWYCERCLSTEVEMKLWVNLKTKVCTDDLGDIKEVNGIDGNGEIDTHCANCGKDVNLKRL